MVSFFFLFSPAFVSFYANPVKAEFGGATPPSSFLLGSVRLFDRRNPFLADGFCRRIRAIIDQKKRASNRSLNET
jgi:hypothetical protein